MRFEALQLFQFKNYIQRDFQFTKNIVCITGRNGCGKTTVLDALHFLSFTKSYFLHQDQLSVTRNKAGMRLVGSINTSSSKHTLTCILREQGKKEFLLDSVPYTRFSEHIGRFPCIFVCPDDTQLIMEGPEERRRFIDIACSMVHPEYIGNLNQYNKVLQQRNSLLKHWQQTADPFSLLSVYNVQLDQYSKPIFALRSDVCAALAGHTQKLYETLSESADNIGLDYQSILQTNTLLEVLERNQEKDIYSQRSNYGIHKDEWQFTINDMPMKQAASQGQRKSFIFGIKLALFTLIQERLQKQAVLLLDDFFEKLDGQRAQRLIEVIHQLNTQVFITDTHRERVTEAFALYMDDVQCIDL